MKRLFIISFFMLSMPLITQSMMRSLVHTLRPRLNQAKALSTLSEAEVALRQASLSTLSEAEVTLRQASSEAEGKYRQAQFEHERFVAEELKKVLQLRLDYLKLEKAYQKVQFDRFSQLSYYARLSRKDLQADDHLFTCRVIDERVCEMSKDISNLQLYFEQKK